VCSIGKSWLKISNITKANNSNPLPEPLFKRPISFQILLKIENKTKHKVIDLNEQILWALKLKKDCLMF